MPNESLPDIRAVVNEVVRSASQISGEDLWRSFPGGRFRASGDELKAAWRDYWRAIAIHAFQRPELNLDEDSAFLIDWGIQMADIRPGPSIIEPLLDRLDWERISQDYRQLRGAIPYSLLIASLLLPQPVAGLSSPVELWPGFWIWPAPTTYPPTDPWEQYQHPFSRSPYQTMVNVMHAFPAAMERLQVNAAGANVFFTSLRPWLYDKAGHPLPPDDQQRSSALSEMALAQIATILGTGSCAAIPYVLWVDEPFFGHEDVPALVTPGLMASTMDEPLVLDNEGLRGVRQYADALRAISWLSIPQVSFAYRLEVAGMSLVYHLAEQYVSSTYLEYALLLWSLTCARSSLEAILNAWSASEVLFPGDTRSIKRRLKGIAGTPGSDNAKVFEVVEQLAQLRNTFGHGRHDKRHRRVLLGSEVPRVHKLMTDVLRRVVLEVASDPARYEDREELITWADREACRVGI